MADASIFDGLPKSKAEARQLRSHRYFTGKPCHKGHLAYRNTSDGKCAECLRLQRRNFREVYYHDLRDAPKDQLPRSRREARELRLRHFFTGKPCKYGHIAARNYQGACMECHRLRSLARYLAVRDNPDFKEEKAKQRRRSLDSTRRYRQRQREKHAGRTMTDFCEACRQIGKVTYDHCHLTGMFRGWLCQGCNGALGYVDDDPVRLRLLADYVERHNKIFQQADWIERERARKILGKGRRYEPLQAADDADD